MMIQETIRKMNALKLYGMAHAFTSQVETAAASHLGFEERIGLLIDHEASFRDDRRLQRLLAGAKLADLLRGPCRPPQYERVMLPLTVLRCFDAVLAPSKEAVLKRHTELSSKGIPNIDATARRNAAAEEVRHLAAIEKVKTMACTLAQRGERLTHRNAMREGANRFAPSSVESVVLAVMRSALGKRQAEGLAVATRLGPRYLQRISEAVLRAMPEIGEAQIPLPLGPD